MDKLTLRQSEVYRFIRERLTACGYAPTVREIGARFGIRSTNGVADHIKALKRKGALVNQPSKSRTLQLAEGSPGPQAAPGGGSPAGGPTRRVPLIGQLPSNWPLRSTTADACLVVDAAMLPPKKRVVALRVVGDSMLGAGLSDGATLFLVKTTQAPRPGSLVVVLEKFLPLLRTYAPEQAPPLKLYGVVIGVFHRFAPAR
jgi:repressor LexA